MVNFLVDFLSKARIHFSSVPFLSHATPILTKLKDKLPLKLLSVLFITSDREVTDNVLKDQRDTRSCKGRILKTCTPSWNFTCYSEHGNAKPEPQTCLTNKNTFSNHTLLNLFCPLCIMRKGKRIAVYAHQKISSGDGLHEF